MKHTFIALIIAAAASLSACSSAPKQCPASFDGKAVQAPAHCSKKDKSCKTKKGCCKSKADKKCATKCADKK